jgi:hypothetical protein
MRFVRVFAGMGGGFDGLAHPTYILTPRTMGGARVGEEGMSREGKGSGNGAAQQP